MTFETLKSRIRGTVITVFDPDHAEACDALIRETLERGAQDNVTVIAFRCDPLPEDDDRVLENVLDDLA